MYDCVLWGERVNVEEEVHIILGWGINMSNTNSIKTKYIVALGFRILAKQQQTTSKQ